jgi:hypothetical protein
MKRDIDNLNSSPTLLQEGVATHCTDARGAFATGPAPLRCGRFEIVPGLELQVREDFRPPSTPSELEALLREIRQRLVIHRAH